MNIVRALEVALPELPERVIRRTPPKLDPRVIAKEHLERGEAVVLAKMPGTDLVFRFSPLQWKLIQMFDGVRSPAEVAELFQQETNTAVSEDDVKDLASFLQTDTQLLYKTPFEQNITLQQELRSVRSKRKRFQIADFSDIPIKTWDNADGYITRLYPIVRFMFEPWFVWLSIAMFTVMAWMWADRFGEIWSDSFAFYNFTQKSGRDLIEFWLLFGATAAVHETAHGLAGKHFGATIEKMGFTLMYFAPSFFCDATQVWVIAGKWARIATAIAGIWFDLIVCFLATILWWGTATGMPAHDWAYKIMMVTGIGVSILNLNPLIKLDGYLIFCELIAEPALKESSTAYLSGLVRKHIFRLPVEVPYVPRRRRAFFAVYGVLSGLYSYVLLSFLMVLTYHILRSFTPEWAFVPSLAIGLWVFRSRIKLTVSFMKMLYLDKKERMRTWFTPRRTAALALAAMVILFAPVWPDFVDGSFVLSPARESMLRARVPGFVTAVAVQEGQQVAAGTPLVQLRNLDLQSQASQAAANLRQATALATQAALRYDGFASAEQERQRRVQEDALRFKKLAQLSVTSPISGTVVTPRLADLVGRSLDEGDPLLEIADTSNMKAEIYIPEYAMHDVRIGQDVKLLPNGHLLPLQGKLSQVAAVSASLPTGMMTKEQLQGLNPPRFYVGTVFLHNDGSLRPEMIGIGKIVVGRRSLAVFAARFSRDLVARRVW
jgi:putative peptide zinc metalloprotease protein